MSTYAPLLEGLTVRRVLAVTAVCAAAALAVVWLFFNTYWDLLVSALCVGYTSMLLFTIAGNIRLASPDATHEQLVTAASRAGLLPWIESLPLGGDTPVGAYGAAISGGQRQRLALARALLADPALLILDEPTAHLDPDSRRALTADILTATQGRATLLITHDLDGLDQVDEIVVLDQGRVVARGTHAELLRSGGLYPCMWCRGRHRQLSSVRGLLL